MGLSIIMRIECDHIVSLRKFLADNRIMIYSEDTEDGWVNVNCGQCKVVYETVLDDGADCD